MKTMGVIAPQRWHWEICPYCGKPIGRTAVLKRKMLRISKCKNCKKSIDERFVVW